MLIVTFYCFYKTHLYEKIFIYFSSQYDKINIWGPVILFQSIFVHNGVYITFICKNNKRLVILHL